VPVLQLSTTWSKNPLARLPRERAPELLVNWPAKWSTCDSTSHITVDSILEIRYAIHDMMYVYIYLSHSPYTSYQTCTNLPSTAICLGGRRRSPSASQLNTPVSSGNNTFLALLACDDTGTIGQAHYATVHSVCVIIANNRKFRRLASLRSGLPRAEDLEGLNSSNLALED
jgi:hypothetical protein